MTSVATNFTSQSMPELRALTSEEIGLVAGGRKPHINLRSLLSFSANQQQNNIGAIADNGGTNFSLLNIGELVIIVRH